MIRNYIKTAWRTLIKNKTYATINILGLTIGLCACMLMATVVLDDLSYDQQWSRKDDLYRIVTADTALGLEGRNASALANLGTELKNNFPEVEVAASVRTWEHLFRLEKEDDQTLEVAVIQADTNVWKMLDIQVMEGKPQQYVAGQGNLVISDSFRKKHFPNENPIGKTIYNVSAYQDDAIPFLVTGVMADLPGNTYLRAEALIISGVSRDFYGSTMHAPVGPTVWLNLSSSNSYRYFTIRLRSDDLRQSLTALEQTWKTLMPGAPFEYRFVDERLQMLYKTELQLKQTGTAAAVLAVVIVLLGLVGLITQNLTRRTKEIGIRKVLGASIRQVIMLFIRDLSTVFIISIVVAIPAAYLLMQRWLESYHVRTELDLTKIGLPVVALAGLTVLLIVAQTIRTALANPVESLRDE